MKTLQRLLFTVIFLFRLTNAVQAQQSCSFIIHVDGVNGMNNISCGGENTPCATINHGIDRAVIEGYTHVRIKAGTYQEIIELKDGINLWGGLDAQWALTGLTAIAGGMGSNGEFYTIRATAINTPTVISDLDVLAPNTTTAGKSSYGVHVANSTGIKFQRVTVRGGTGANGSAGVNGSDASLAGVNGLPGGNGAEFNTQCNDSVSGTGGNGAVTPGYSATAGGKGGRGGYMDTDCNVFSPNFTATIGINGFSAAISTINSYGYRGSGGNLCSAGADGNDGQTLHGTGGNGATSAASVVAQFFAPISGTNGTLGDNGTGGGGGGGSGGCDDGTDAYGAGGGGGGSGGIAAPNAGSGGMSGGNSAAVFLFSSTCSFIDCQIILGNGGRGGKGGNSGLGSVGGSGGLGGTGVGTGNGGDGGDGGDGGNSGGGGGGAGGAAYGIYGSNSIINRVGTVFSGGSGGTNGLGGTGTPSGVEGSDGTTGILSTIGGSVTDITTSFTYTPDPCIEIITIDLAEFSFCAGEISTVNYNAVGSFDIGNTFTAQLSDANGSFSSPVDIGSVLATGSDTINVQFPLNTTGGTGYRIRVVSSSPALTATENATDITINELPVVTANATDTSICAGNLVTLSGSGAHTYIWNNGADDGVAFVPTDSIYYTVTGTDTTTTCVNIDSVLVAVVNLSDTSIIQNGNQLETVLTGATYQWLDCDNSFAPVAGDTASIFTPIVSGNYAVLITQNNCSITSSCYNITIVGINDDALTQGVLLYPNPSQDGRIVVKSNLKQSAIVEIFDITGKSIVRNLLKGKTILNIPGKGIFFVRTTFSDGITNTQKVLVY